MSGRIPRFLCLSLALACVAAGHNGSRAQSYAISAAVADNISNNSNCSLREAIFAALTNAARDACPAGSAAETDVIMLEAGGVYALTLSGVDDTNNAGDIDFTAGEAVLATDLIIRTDGDTPATIVQQVAGQRIFDNHGADVRLENIIVTGGTGAAGAGYRGLGGTLEADGTTFRENFANAGSSPGGGLFIGDLSSATISGATFDGNVAGGYGGGMSAVGPVIVRDSLFTGNQAAVAGGGISLFLTTVEVVNSTFVNSAAGPGADSGIEIHAGNGGVATVNNSTFTDSLSSTGAAVIVSNDGATVTVTNSIVIATNTDIPACMTNGDMGATLSGHHNRVHELGSPCDGTGTELLSANSLTVLGNYGGPTQTRLLRPGSNALDAGDAATCDAADARGAARRLGMGLCDIGAIEMFRLGLTAPASTPESGVVNYTVTITPAVPEGMSVPVDAYTSEDTAEADDDYLDADVALTFDADHPTQTLPVSHIADDYDEDDEFYDVHLEEDDGLAIVPSDLSGTITDDDTAGVGASPLSFSLTEGGADAPVSIWLTSKPRANVDVTLTYHEDDLTIGIMRAEASSTIVPDDWQVPLDLTVAALADLYDEGGEIETITIAIASDDPRYDGMVVAPMQVTVVEMDSNLVVNGGFEADGAGGATTGDKHALGWTASPGTTSKNRRNCKHFGAGTLCAWVFSGSPIAQRVKQALTLPDYAVGDSLALSGSARRKGISKGTSIKLQVKLLNGGKGAAKVKFKAGTDGAHIPFAAQVVMNVPLSEVASATVIIATTAKQGRIAFDDIAVHVVPLDPRGVDVLPPPSAPEGMRRGGN